MFNEDKIEFITRAEKEAKSSLLRLYEQPSSDCTIIFTEPKPAHNKLKERLFKIHNVNINSTKTGDDHLSERSPASPNLLQTSTHSNINGSTPIVKGQDFFSPRHSAGEVSESDVYLEQLVTEVKKPFLYDTNNSVTLNDVSTRLDKLTLSS